MPDSSQTTQIRNTVRSFAEGKYTGFLVALWLPADAASDLALPGHVAGEELHVTLCYCTDADEWDELRTARAISSVERAVGWRSTLDGQVGGYGRFMASETSDAQDVFYAAVDVPGLAELRGVVESALCEAQCPPSDIHGYTPHISLAYIDPSASNPVDRLPPVDLHFGAVSVLVGDKRMDIPLSTPLAIFAVKDEATADKPAEMHVYQAMQFTEAPEWAPFLPTPGVYHHPIYGQLDYTSETYGRIIDHFKEGIYQDRLPVNAEHDPQAAGAVGWIVDMRLSDSGAIEVKVEWNDRGRSLIEGDRFRYVSAELYPWWTDPVDPERNYQDVAVGMAICTQPFFKESVLPPLVASEAILVRTAGEPGKEHEVMGSEKKPDEEQKPATPAEETSPDGLTPAQMSEQVLKEFRELQSTVAKQNQTIATLSETNSALQTDVRKKRFTDEVRGRSDDNGTVWIGDIDKHVSMLCDLADKFGEQSEQVTQYIQTNRQHSEQIRTSDLFREFGTGRAAEGTGQAKIDAAAANLMSKDPKLTREAAVTQVLREKPELYSEYNQGH